MQVMTKILSRAIVSGSAAAAASAVVAAARAQVDGSAPYAPINAVTHCIWPQRAFAETGLSVRFTLTGLVIHHASAIFWAAMFESVLRRLQGDRAARANPGLVAAAAGATAAMAYAVDYHAVPKRLTPGFEAHLSQRSMFYVYAGLAAGLAVAALARRE